MTKIITLRLKERELNFIEELSKKENEDRSYAARKLIDYGWIYFILKNYKEGKTGDLYIKGSNKVLLDIKKTGNTLTINIPQ